MAQSPLIAIGSMASARIFRSGGPEDMASPLLLRLRPPRATSGFVAAELPGVADAVKAEIAAHMCALHRRPPADLAHVAAALRVERGEVLALEAGQDLALGVLKGAPAGRGRLACVD